MRLDKTLCHAGWGSRREVHVWIRQGRVTADGAVVRDPAAHITNPATVCLDGDSIDFEPEYTLMLHKPAGVLTATEDKHQQTVLDLLPARYQRLSPVGRLDKDTTGLLILTTDGALSHRLTAPNSLLPKVYEATVEGALIPGAAVAFSEGLVLADGTVCRPAKLEQSGENIFRITLTEGKYHQVKRMVAACGGTVVALHRIQIGKLSLDPGLNPGEFRRMTREDIYLALEHARI